jgi:cyclopropane-fatty-acyl-phospholipid synthase
MEFRRAKNLLADIIGPQPVVPCQIHLWDGSELSFGKPPAFRLEFRSEAALDSLLADPSMGFGEAYVKGDIEVEGDFGAAMALAYQQDLFSRLSPVQKAHICWLNIKRRTSLHQARRDVQSHYDRGNAFYQLWLDKGLNYSCAYFRKPDDSLEKAQEQKIAYILHKVRLRPGQRLLDIGCGWGSLVLEAARAYDARAVGITLSKQQCKLARERITEAGFEKRVEIRLADYRELRAEKEGAFDRIVSVGMFEHVGRENILTFFQKVSELLRPKGLLLLHTIGRVKPEPMDLWIRTYIFPGTYLPAVGQLLEASEDAGFDFLDFEDLRQHYDRTLEYWAERFEAHLAEVRDMMGDAFVRMWRLYLNGCQMAFRHGQLRVFQLLSSLGRRDDWPLTRHWLYDADMGQERPLNPQCR